MMDVLLKLEPVWWATYTVEPRLSGPQLSGHVTMLFILLNRIMVCY